MRLRLPFVRRGDDGERARRALELVRTELRGQLALVDRLITDERARIVDELATADLEMTAAAVAATPIESSAWGDERWTSWTPRSSSGAAVLRLGETADARLPVGTALATDPLPLVLVGRSADTNELARSLLTSIVLRAACAMPRQVRFTLLDAADEGAPFAVARRLERVTTGFGDTRRAVEQVAGDVSRIEETYLSRQYRTLADVPASRRLGESTHVVAVASFPHRFDEFSVDSIVELCRRGPACNVQLVVHLDLAASSDAEILLDRFRSAGAELFELGETPAHPSLVDVRFDEAPPGHVQQLVLQRIPSATPADEPIDWAAVAQPSDGEWGSFPTIDSLSTPIAANGTDAPVELMFGTDPTTGARVGHGLFVGASTHDRRDFLDAMVAGLVVRYTPDKLRLALLGAPDSDTFSEWRGLPHLDLVGISPTATHIAEALAALRAEVDERLGSTRRRSIRKLMVVDGADRFLAEADDRSIADLRHVLERGQDAGVHLLIGASRFRAFGPLHRAALFELFDLRIALQLADDDALGREEFGARGGRLVDRVCDRPRRAVVNTLAGLDEGTFGTQLLVLDPARRAEIVQRVLSLSAASPIDRAVIVDGNRVLDFSDSRLLAELAAVDETAREATMRDLALRGRPNGGLGLDDWDPADGPRLVTLGASEALSGETTLVLRRRPTENVVAVSPHAGVLVSVGLAAAVGAHLSAGTGQSSVTLLATAATTGDTPDPLSHGLAVLARAGAHVRVMSSEREIARSIDDEAAEVDRRRRLGQDALESEPTRLVVIRHPDRIRTLGRTPFDDDRSDPPLGQTFRRLLANGPAVGVHVVVLASSLTAARVVMSEDTLQQAFRHRIVSRLPADDSFVLVRSGAAAALVDGGDRTTAMLFDGHVHTTARFTPFRSGAAIADNVAGAETGDDLERLLCAEPTRA